jgi:hypothetical protein
MNAVDRAIAFLEHQAGAADDEPIVPGRGRALVPNKVRPRIKESG